MYIFVLMFVHKLSKIYALVIIGHVLQKVCWKYILIIYFEVILRFWNRVNSKFCVHGFVAFQITWWVKLTSPCKQSIQNILFRKKHVTCHNMKGKGYVKCCCRPLLQWQGHCVMSPVVFEASMSWLTHHQRASHSFCCQQAICVQWMKFF